MTKIKCECGKPKKSKPSLTKVFYLSFEEGFPSSEDAIRIEEINNVHITVFKRGFNWFTSLARATEARNKIITALKEMI